VKKIVLLVTLTVLSLFCLQNLCAQTKYDFVVVFDSYKLPKSDGSWNEPINKPSTLSFSKNGKACIEFGNEKYEFEYTSIKPITYKWEKEPNGFQISIDDDNCILVSSTSNFAIINIEKICPYMNFLNWSNQNVLRDILAFYNELSSQ
jgi:hypothetical protein